MPQGGFPRLNKSMPRASSGVLLTLLALVLTGCTSTLSSLPTELGGLPADAPAPLENQLAYPAVHDMPPPREGAIMTPDELQKAQADMIQARKRQARQSSNPDERE